LGLLDSTSDVDIGGHFVVGVFWRVVSVGSEHLSLYSQKDTCVAILLDFLFTSTSCLFLDSFTAILWDLACFVLVAMISGTAGPVFSVLLPQQLLRLVPGPAQ
jgi:hypothetical protein